jgi:hypothetical protein
LLLDEAVFVLDLLLQVTVVLLQLADDETLGKVMASMTLLTSTFILTRLVESLLQSDSQFFEFLISRIQFSLNLLQLRLEFGIFILRQVVGYLQVSELILQILFLELGEIVH